MQQVERILHVRMEVNLNLLLQAKHLKDLKLQLGEKVFVPECQELRDQ